MESPHTVLELLRDRRDRAQAGIATTGDFGVAVCEVLDELIRRAQVFASEYPKGESVTLQLVEEMPAVTDALAALLETLAALSSLIEECADAVGARRDPAVKFVARVRSEGFEVADNFTVTEARQWPLLDNASHPDTFVQQEAEKTVRAERAAAYHERLVRMATAFDNARDKYTQRARNLINTTLDG